MLLSNMVCVGWLWRPATVPIMPTPSRELPSSECRTSDRYQAEAKSLGARVRAARKAKCWTLDQAAEAAGMDYQHIQKIECGKLNVTLVTLVRLAEGFGVELGAFFTDD